MKLQRAVHFEVLKGVRSRAKHGSGSVYQIVIAAPAEPRAAVAAVVYFTVEKVASIISHINLLFHGPSVILHQGITSGVKYSRRFRGEGGRAGGG